MKTDTNPFLLGNKMEKKGMAADSSFFICYVDDINQCDMLYTFVKLYDIYIGEKILEETKNLFNDTNLLPKFDRWQSF